jgi:hypothetical protein
LDSLLNLFGAQYRSLADEAATTGPLGTEIGLSGAGPGHDLLALTLQLNQID